MKILLLMSGSIACAKATQLLSSWRKAGHEVRVATTSSVSHFVGAATLDGLSGAPLFDDTFAGGQAMEHITLAQWADVLVVCPASANLLARFAHGVADDAVSTLWQAAWGRGIPLVVVPAMNGHMWAYPATQANVAQLQSWGVHVLPTAEGELACGETGQGRMLEPADIEARIAALMQDTAGRPGRKLLITGGGTREPIDAVRYIGNHSSGRTAAELAEALVALGHEVTWLGGAGAQQPGGGVALAHYTSFRDLESQLQDLLAAQRYDAVSPAAAVSDFSGSQGGGSDKLPSSEPLKLLLTPNPKLLPQLRSWSRNKALCVVGFKLTVGAEQAAVEQAVARVFAAGDTDLVVHNDLHEIRPDVHSFTLYRAAGQSATIANRQALAQALSCYLEERS